MTKKLLSRPRVGDFVSILDSNKLGIIESVRGDVALVKVANESPKEFHFSQFVCEKNK